VARRRKLAQAGAVGTIRRGAQKVLQVLADDEVEHARLERGTSV
jgi:hypothetical protein